MILFTRFRDLPDNQMKYIAEYVADGKPIIGIRTATHAFAPETSPTYQNWHWKNPNGEFGRIFLGETWISHHGVHGRQSTRGIVAPEKAGHPIFHGIKNGEIWGSTDVYTVKPTSDSDVILLGQVLSGMTEHDVPIDGPKNNPMMPIAWTRNYTTNSGRTGRVFTTTMGSSEDLQNEAFRRMLVNAIFWALGMENKIPKRANVNLVGTFTPSRFKFGGYQRGYKPAQF